MLRARLAELFNQSLADSRLSRSEKKALREVVAELITDSRSRELWREHAFQAARVAIAHSTQPAEVLKWLKQVLNLTTTPLPKNTAEAFFSPGEGCRQKIISLFNNARREVDVCVFTITDDQIAEALIKAHQRGVKIRILTDDLKAEDRGSDVAHFEEHRIPLCVDNSEKHMHHKFAIFDQNKLVTGSYNWTVSAWRANEENIIVTSDKALITAFQTEFDALWLQYSA